MQVRILPPTINIDIGRRNSTSERSTDSLSCVNARPKAGRTWDTANVRSSSRSIEGLQPSGMRGGAFATLPTWRPTSQSETRPLGPRRKRVSEVSGREKTQRHSNSRSYRHRGKAELRYPCPDSNVRNAG